GQKRFVRPAQARKKPPSKNLQRLSHGEPPATVSFCPGAGNPGGRACCCRRLCSLALHRRNPWRLRGPGMLKDNLQAAFPIPSRNRLPRRNERKLPCQEGQGRHPGARSRPSPGMAFVTEKKIKTRPRFRRG